MSFFNGIVIIDRCGKERWLGMKKKQKTVGSRVQVPVWSWHLPKHMRKGISPDLISKKTGASGKISRQFRSSLSD